MNRAGLVASEPGPGPRGCVHMGTPEQIDGLYTLVRAYSYARAMCCVAAVASDYELWKWFDSGCATLSVVLRENLNTTER